MWSMVDTDGSVEVASQWADSQIGEERKVDQIVCELERYDVVVRALQETKWFGSEVYEVGGSVLLTSSRVIPASGEAVQRERRCGISAQTLGFGCLEERGKAVEGVELEMCFCLLATGWMW